MKEVVVSLIVLISTALLPVSSAAGPLLSPIFRNQEVVLAERFLDISIRDEDPYTNEVFAYNILLALDYLGNGGFVLQPGEIFAFHSNVLSEFAEPKVTMNSRFFIEEGYKSIGGLGGNGVCHLASLMNWVASEAGLEVVAPNGHNFAPISGAPEEYGTSIRFQSPNQNLYIKNNFDYPVRFVFKIAGQLVFLRIEKPAT